MLFGLDKINFSKNQEHNLLRYFIVNPIFILIRSQFISPHLPTFLTKAFTISIQAPRIQRVKIWQKDQ